MTSELPPSTSAANGASTRTFTIEPAAEPPAEWLPAPIDSELRHQLLEDGVDQLIADLLVRRGVRSAEEAQRFLEPALEHLHDPGTLHGMEEAVDRLLEIRSQAETVAIVGDYDVDGVSGTALLAASMRACGWRVVTILPHRMRDGYGFQQTQVEEAERRGCGLVLTVDCGTTSAEAIRASRARGMDVIVTDHHTPGADLPEDVIQLNPKQAADSSPNDDLCGAGLAFKLACALFQAVDRPVPMLQLLRIACLGTIADVVPLRGENRVIAALGLRSLESSRSPGLRALIDVAKVKPPLSAQDIGYRIGPRINAAGRMDSPDLALDLLLSRDAQEARSIAERLDLWNQERQGEERSVIVAAREQLQRQRGEDGRLAGILVGWSEDWHRGVVGIAAGRLARELHRPVVLMAVEDGRATGSGRSIAGVHLHDFLARWRARYERFGGHDHAIGLTVAEESLEEIATTWRTAARWEPGVLRRRLEYDLHLERADAIDTRLYRQLQQLEPFGQANPVPKLRLGPLEPAMSPRVFGNGHLKITARDRSGATVPLVAWHGEALLEEARGPFEVLGELTWDDYLGRASLTVSDLRALPPS